MNKKYNVDIFSTLGVEKHLQPNKSFRLKAMEKRLSQNPKPYEMMEKPVDNMNNLPSAKYKQIPNEIKKIH